MTEVYIFEATFVPGIVEALAVQDMATEVLPELTTLRLIGYRSSLSVEKAAEKFVATRRLAGRTVYLTDGGRATRYTQPCSKSNSRLIYSWVRCCQVFYHQFQDRCVRTVCFLSCRVGHLQTGQIPSAIRYRFTLQALA